jgi:hypothetical protein
MMMAITGVASPAGGTFDPEGPTTPRKRRTIADGIPGREARRGQVS